MISPYILCDYQDRFATREYPTLSMRSTRIFPFLLAAAMALPSMIGCSNSTQPVAQNCPPPVQCPPCPPSRTCPVCPPETRPPETATPQNAPPFRRGDWNEIVGWESDDLQQAWPALLASCRAIGQQQRWQTVCVQAVALGTRPATAIIRGFFERNFTPWLATNPDGTVNGMVTGYYEPLITGSRTRSERYRWPVYGVPQDMLTIELGGIYPELKNLRLRGRLEGNKIVPYWTRAELERMGGALPAPVLLWADEPIDLFFLQIQGSGQVQLPDGSRVRIGYADQNGHPYQSIGRWLIAQGQLQPHQASMQGIKKWAHAHPARLSELLNTNPSFVFFRELTASDEGPFGSLGVPLTPERSIAVDPAAIPLGAPVFLSTTYPLSDRPLNRLMLAQDTGSAIKGVVRADFFWGFGAEAGKQAGQMRQQGQMWLLLPRGVPPAGVTP